MKIWRPYPQQSDCCGNDVEIFTDADLPYGYGYDGDDIRCVECGGLGYLSGDEDGCWIHWLSEDE